MGTQDAERFLRKQYSCDPLQLDHFSVDEKTNVGVLIKVKNQQERIFDAI